VRIVDSTDGTPEEGVIAATAGLAFWYRREGGLRVAIAGVNDLGALTSAWNSGGLLHIDDGYYRLDVPNAAFIVGADGVAIGGVATGMVVIGVYYQCTDSIADGVWDEVLTVGTHNVVQSAGRRLRQLGANMIYEGVVVSALTNTVVLDAGAAAVNNVYRSDLIVLMSGAGAGQARIIVEYVGGGTNRATIDRPWVTIPSPADEFMILAFAQEITMAFGTVVSATPSTIRLAATESIVNNVFRYSVIVVTSSTGATSEARLISAYDGATQTVTVAPNWTVTPNPGDVYKVMPVGRAVMESATADSINAAALANDAVLEIQSGLATSVALGTVSGLVAAIKAKTDVLPASVTTDVFAKLIDGYTFEKVVQVMAAVLAGKTTDAGTDAPKFRDLADTLNRIAATTDSGGNRLTVVIT
jgi:hypothetical protein